MDLRLASVWRVYNTAQMSVNAIINASNLDINKISFGDIRINKTNGSKSVPIKYNGQNFQMRIPKIEYPMGVSIKETENGINYTMLASLRGCDSYAKERAPVEAGEVGQLYNFLKDLEDKVIHTSVEKSSSWFGRARKEDVLRDSMKALVSPSVEKQGAEWVANGKYPPSFRMKVPVYDGKVNMDAVDMANRPIPLTTENLETVFPKRMEARFIVSPSIYVSGQGFGVTWRISYAQVSARQRVTASQVFEAEEESEETVQVPTEESVQVEEEEQIQEEETPKQSTPVQALAPAPVPQTPAPVKTARRRPVGAAI
jgi:hypothetical protein